MMQHYIKPFPLVCDQESRNCALQTANQFVSLIFQNTGISKKNIERKITPIFIPEACYHVYPPPPTCNIFDVFAFGYFV